MTPPITKLLPFSFYFFYYLNTPISATPHFNAIAKVGKEFRQLKFLWVGFQPTNEEVIKTFDFAL